MRSFSVALALAAIAGAWLWVGPDSGPRLRAENYVHIRVGMTQAEVEQLLGGPPGNYGWHSRERAMMTNEASHVPPRSVEQIWCDDCNRLEIYFDATGRVAGLHKRKGYRQKAW